MNTVIGLFEDPNHVRSAIDALQKQGFGTEKIKTLNNEYISAEADSAVRHKRASDISAIAGMLFGGYFGMAAGGGASALAGYLFGISFSALGVAAVLIAGAILGAIVGIVFAPGWVKNYIQLDNGFTHTDAYKRDGILLVVNTDSDNEAIATKIMRGKEAINVESRGGVWPPAPAPAV